MNPSGFYSSIYTATDIDLFSTDGACCDATQPYPPFSDYPSGLYEDYPSSAEDPSGQGQNIGLVTYSDADRAFFEEFLTAEVASVESCTAVPSQSSSSYSSYSMSNSLRYFEPLFASNAYSEATSSPQSNLSSSFEQTFPELGNYSTTAMSEPSRAHQRMSCPSRWSCPYPSPSPEPSPKTTSIATTSNLQVVVPPHAGPSHTSLAFGHLHPESPIACISPEVVCPSAYSGHGLEHDRSVDGSFPLCHSRPSRRAARRSPPSAPYPTPSPEPSPRTSSTVFASQRRNAPARTAEAPVASDPWQCPHCPYVQRNRRSPDLKRHVKTHTRGADVADWVCCGVPVLNALELGVPAATVREARVFEFDGTLMLGGCRKEFSRRDALMRHLQREKGRCFGDAQSLHQRGNRETRRC